MGSGDRLPATDMSSSGTSSWGTNPQAESTSLSSKTEKQMRKEDGRKGVELRNDGFRKWTVTGKVFLQVSILPTEKERF